MSSGDRMDCPHTGQPMPLAGRNPPRRLRDPRPLFRVQRNNSAWAGGDEAFDREATATLADDKTGLLTLGSVAEVRPRLFDVTASGLDHLAPAGAESRSFDLSKGFGHHSPEGLKPWILKGGPVLAW